MPKLTATEAEFRAKLKQERAAEGAQAMKDYRAAEIASRANTFRLRELRLATKEHDRNDKSKSSDWFRLASRKF